MTERADQRQDDRGREARRLGVKDWLQIVTVLLAIAAVIWQGGKVTGELQNVSQRVGTLEASVNGLRTDFSREQIEGREVKVRVDNHDRDIGGLDRRLSRIERRGGD